MFAQLKTGVEINGGTWVTRNVGTPLVTMVIVH
jgi:hypothetical protein